jgi:hypothetical protein
MSRAGAALLSRNRGEKKSAGSNTGAHVSILLRKDQS